MLRRVLNFGGSIAESANWKVSLAESSKEKSIDVNRLSSRRWNVLNPYLDCPCIADLSMRFYFDGARASG